MYDRSQESSYSEFTEYVRRRLGKSERTIEPAGLQRQLDALEASLGEDRVRSSKVLTYLLTYQGTYLLTKVLTYLLR